MKTQARPIDDLELDERCQTRAETDHDAIESYREAYADGITLPPVEAVELDGVLYVVDGFHRLAAARQAGHEFIRVQVVEKADDIERAQWVALSKNQAHGVRRSDQDKRKAIRMALENGIGVEQSSRTIAEHVGVSQSLVSTVRREWEAEQVSLKLSDTGHTPATVMGRDGRKHPKQRKRAEHPEDDGDTAERYAQAARMIDRLWQKLTGLLGADDPVCDGLRELHRCAKEGADG